LDEPLSIGTSPEDHQKLIIWNIRRNWQILASEGKQPLPPRDDLIGILRTILGSIEFWRSERMHSRAYLSYLEEFMKKAGVSITVSSSSGEPLPALEDEDEDEDDPVR
jgi:hypothetical protein